MSEAVRKPAEGSAGRARSLRRDASPPEVVLWSRLRARRLGGHKFRRQQAVGRYVADFYCAEAALVVEIDGEGHAGRREKDSERDRWMRAEGIEVMRVSASRFSKDLDWVLEKIRRLADARIATRKVGAFEAK